MDSIREHKLMTLLSDDPSLILLLKNRYITDNMWKICIEKEPSLFQYMKDPSEAMCLFAVREDGNNLKYIKELSNVKITDRMIWSAVCSCPSSILEVPKDMLNDALIEKSFDLDPSLMSRFKHIRREYLLSRLKDRPSIIQFVNDPDEDIMCEAIKITPNACTYIKKFTPKIKELIETMYPEVAKMMHLDDIYKGDN